jgi:hypothetical protein
VQPSGCCNAISTPKPEPNGLVVHAHRPRLVCTIRGSYLGTIVEVSAGLFHSCAVDELAA